LTLAVAQLADMSLNDMMSLFQDTLQLVLSRLFDGDDVSRRFLQRRKRRALPGLLMATT